jgi:hypothetical protein
VSSRLNQTAKSLNFVNCTFACRAVLKDEAGKAQQDFSTSITSTYTVRGEATKEEAVVDGKKVKQR